MSALGGLLRRQRELVGLRNASVAFTMPTTPGTYSLRLYEKNTWTLLASSPTITVAGVTFSVDATNVAPGGTVTATVGNGPANLKDWVGLYAVGSPAELDWKFLNGSRTAPTTGLTNATLSFTLPTAPGNYVLRFYLNDTYTVLGTSATMTVTAPSLTFTLSTTTSTPGGTVSATIANGPGNAKDWVALYAVGGTMELDWKFLNGSRTAPTAGTVNVSVPFTMPTTPGTYVIRFYSNNTYALLAQSAQITVSAPTVLGFTASPATSAPGGTVTGTIVNGPGYAMDWVALYTADGSSMLDWKFLNGSQTTPVGLTAAAVAFIMPSAPGTYMLRFYLNNTSTVLATSAPIIVL
jgi:hypothetical protein